MSVWIASYPRSGNTFLRMLLKHSWGVSTYSVYDDPLFEQIGASDVIGHERLPRPPDELAAADRLYFVKTHGVPMDNCPAIYLVRDGRDALVSYARYTRSFGRKPAGWRQRWKDTLGLDGYDRVLRRLIEQGDEFGSWGDHVLRGARRGGATAVLHYEDLIVTPDQCVSRTLDSLEIPAARCVDTMPEFSRLQERWPQFFRKGQVGAWRTEMPRELHSMFWRHHGHAMEAMGSAREGV